MSISITSLLPAKNEDNVSVNTDIELTITSTLEDLDLDTVIFYINGISVKPTVYYGLDKKSINIKFYGKSKIKYNTRKYGQEDFRYGQEDIYPSNFHYGQRYTNKVYVEDVVGNSFEESFTFTIEEGIFYNSDYRDYYYCMTTQGLSNNTPEWARSRYDKFSNFQQLMNPIGGIFEDLDYNLVAQLSGYYPQTSNLNELSKLYKVELKEDYTFNNITLDDGTRLQVPPEIYGIQGITKFDIHAEFNNTIDDFYTLKLPTRLNSEKIKLDSEYIYPESDITNIPIELSKKLDIPGRIWVQVKEKEDFSIANKDALEVLTLRIMGKSVEGQYQEEDMIIYSNKVYITEKRWGFIDTIQFSELQSNTGKFILSYTKDSTQLIEDTYREIDFDDTLKQVSWSIKQENYGTILQINTSIHNRIMDILASNLDQEVVREYEIYDIDNVTNVSIDYIIPDEYSNNIYGVNNDYLYIYDKREEYPSVIKRIDSDNGESTFVIELDTTELSRGENGKTVYIKAVQREAGKVISQYRIKITKPDLTEIYLLEDGTITNNQNQAIIIAKTRDLLYESRMITYIADMPGDYIVELEAIYREGIKEKDAKIFRNIKKSAKAKYKLDRILGDNSIVNAYMGVDQKIKIYDSNSYLHTITFNRDNVLIDYKESTLYFSENYSEIGIE
jgi:hypothetical protein